MQSPQQQQQPPLPQRQEIRQRQVELPRNIEIRDMGNMELDSGSQPDHDYDISSHASSRLEPNNHLEDRQVPHINLNNRSQEDALYE